MIDIYTCLSMIDNDNLSVFIAIYPYYIYKYLDSFDYI